MPDIRSQLRWYYQSLIRLRDPGDVIAGRAGGAKVGVQPESAPIRSWWRRPAAVATAAALAALVLAGSTLLGLRLAGTNGVTSETPPAQWSYPISEVPPFHATIAWDEDLGSAPRLGAPAPAANIEVWYESPGRFRFEQTELSWAFNLGGPGSLIAGDGQRLGWYSAAEPVWHDLQCCWPYLNLLFWEPMTLGSPFDWAGQCGEHASAPTPEEVAGRETYHIVCPSLPGEPDLWVDSRTGLILQMRGETPSGQDTYLGTSAAGGFTVTAIEFFDNSIPEGQTLLLVGQSPIAALLNGLPPFHVVVAVEGVQAYTQEIWLRDSENWKVATLTSKVDWETPGTVSYLTDGVYTRFRPACDPSQTPGYWVEPRGEPYKALLEDLFPLEATTTIAGEPPVCAEVGTEVLLGRQARHLRCQWGTSGTVVEERWLDVETGLQLKSAGGLRPITVLSIEVDAALPDITFTPEPAWRNLSDPSACTANS